MAVSFDCFGTLVDVDRTGEPALAVATELERRDVTVPDGWKTIYASDHRDIPAVNADEATCRAEYSLVEHVSRALDSEGIPVPTARVRESVLAAFDPGEAVRTRPGAEAAVAAAGARGPVAICSNCAVPGLVRRTLRSSTIDLDAFDAVVTSVDCGWRKPAPAIFEATAAALETTPRDLVHVGDDPRADGGIEALGGTALLLDDVSLERVPSRLGVDR